MSRSDVKRCFLAIPLPDPVRAVTGALQRELQKAGADVKWVEPHNLHITFKFLGDVQTGKISSIVNILKKEFLQQKTLSITLDELGAFPSLQAPRIIWLGSRHHSSLIAGVVARIDSQMATLGFKKEDRPFFTHATLGRIRSPQNKIALLEKIKQMNPGIPPQSFESDGIVLLESQLSSTGPTYALIEKFDLV